MEYPVKIVLTIIELPGQRTNPRLTTASPIGQSIILRNLRVCSYIF